MKLLTIEDALPCPFCGGTTSLLLLDYDEAQGVEPDEPRYYPWPTYTVMCSRIRTPEMPLQTWQPGCGGSSGYYPTPERALASWNRRTP